MDQYKVKDKILAGNISRQLDCTVWINMQYFNNYFSGFSLPPLTGLFLAGDFFPFSVLLFSETFTSPSGPTPSPATGDTLIPLLTSSDLTSSPFSDSSSFPGSSLGETATIEAASPPSPLLDFDFFLSLFGFGTSLDSELFVNFSVPSSP